jgi:hypothetical protein
MNILENSKLKVAHAFLVLAQLGPAHGFNGLARLGSRPVASTAQPIWPMVSMAWVTGGIKGS